MLNFTVGPVMSSKEVCSIGALQVPYLEQLSLMDNPHIMTVEFPRETFYDLFRFEKASWDNETIRICLESWGRSYFQHCRIRIRIKSAYCKTIDKYFFVEKIKL